MGGVFICETSAKLEEGHGSLEMIDDGDSNDQT